MFVLGALGSARVLARGWRHKSRQPRGTCLWSCGRGPVGAQKSAGGAPCGRAWSSASIQNDRPRMLLNYRARPHPEAVPGSWIRPPGPRCALREVSTGPPHFAQWTVRGRGAPRVFKRLPSKKTAFGAVTGCLNTSYVALCGPPLPLDKPGRPEAGPSSRVAGAGPATRTCRTWTLQTWAQRAGRAPSDAKMLTVRGRLWVWCPECAGPWIPCGGPWL